MRKLGIPFVRETEKKMGTSTSFKKAKRLSLRKWNAIAKMLYEVAPAATEACGFCFRAMNKRECFNCKDCEAHVICHKGRYTPATVEEKLYSVAGIVEFILEKIESLEEKK